MKAVILAAGLGNRMKELTVDTPKPLLSFQDRTLLEHKFEALPDQIDEIVLVIGYLGEKIQKYFGDSWQGKNNAKNIRYVVQAEQLGTAHALLQAKPLLKASEPFLVLMGDDIYEKSDLEKLINTGSWSSLMENPTKEIMENEKDIFDGRYTGACFLTPEVFDLAMVAIEGKEFGLPQTFAKAALKRPIAIIKSTKWRRITTPTDLYLD